MNWVCEEDFIEVIAVINNCWKKLFYGFRKIKAGN